MKKYKIKYHDIDMSRLNYIIQISKSGKVDGVGIWFWIDGRKICQNKWKNDLRNGIYRSWRWNSIQNWEKENRQGIKILFK